MDIQNSEFDSDDLIRLFNEQFLGDFCTKLVGSGDEPIYLPASEEQEFNQIIFRDDYFASALHEITHWCIAGPHRRTLVDFGYWYIGDGRDAEQQARFEKVEVEPQALEWILTSATGFRFGVSTDNLRGTETDSEPFKKAVVERAQRYCKEGLPTRAAQFRKTLANFYDKPESLDSSLYTLENL